MCQHASLLAHKIQNRVLEASWGIFERLGGLLGRLGRVLERLVPILERLGSVLGRLGRVLGRLGGVLVVNMAPTWLPKRSPNRSKIEAKIKQLLNASWDLMFMGF